MPQKSPSRSVIAYLRGTRNGARMLRPAPSYDRPVCGAGLLGSAQAHEKVFEGGEEGGAATQPEAHCDDGLARGFPCWNVDLLAWLPPGVFGYGLGNDIWGWTDPKSGREIALLGLRRGTAYATGTRTCAGACTWWT